MCKSNYWIWHRVERPVQNNPDIPILVSDLLPKTILLQRIPAIQPTILCVQGVYTICTDRGYLVYIFFCLLVDLMSV